MSSFICEHCGKRIIDNGNYITECEHYPLDAETQAQIRIRRQQ